MNIKKMKKEELELMSYKDITYLLIEEDGAANTADLFRKIVDLLELSNNIFETKIGDYYTSLSTDKRFILLDDGKWDLKTKHPKKNIDISSDLEEFDDLELEESQNESIDDMEENEDNYDDESGNDNENEYKDLIIVDEEELGLDE